MRHLTIALLISLAAQAPESAVRVVPNQDGTLAGYATTMREMRALATRAAGGDGLAAYELWLRRYRFGPALDELERLLEGDPAQIERAIELTSERLHDITRDHAAGHDKRLGALTARLKARLPSMPREDAARIAFKLPAIESRTGLIANRDFSTRVQQLLSEYAGTDEALLQRASGPDVRGFGETRAVTLEHFARAHPRTVAGATALFNAGQALQSDTSGDRNRDPDPTERFLRVHDIMTELQSGAWPDSRAVRDAPQLLIGFHAYQPRYAPANLDRVLEAYRAFVARNFAIDPRHVTGNGIGYLISSKIPELLKLKGQALTAMDAYFEEWAKTAAQPDAVQYMRASVYERWIFEHRDQAEVWAARARDAFAALAAAGDGPWHRAALASFANLQLQAEDFPGAIRSFERYLSRYPSSESAWIVALRLGQAYEETGDWTRAEAAYGRAAADPNETIAVILGAVHAGRAAEARNQPAGALRRYQDALKVWEPYDRMGYELSFRFSKGNSSRTPKSAVRIARSSVAADEARLERALTTPDGPAVEFARSLVKQERWTDAIAAIDTLLSEKPRTASAADAGLVRNLARLHYALDLADVEKPAPDAAAAARVLQSIDGPWSAITGLARVAEAALVFRRGDDGAASAAMQRALDEWRANQPVPRGGARLANGLEEDVAEIRRIVFQPLGGAPFDRGKGWNAFEWPKTPSPFALVRPDVLVTTADGVSRAIEVFRASPSNPSALFLDDQARDVLSKIVFKLGGTRARAATHVMQTPNQPVGGSMEILAFWNRFFPSRPGHWGGWEFETYPVINEIEFYDAARTRAGAKITVGYSGATVVLQKIDGSWQAVDLMNFWIT